MKFRPEILILRQFHPAILTEIIGAILWRIMRKARRNGERHTIHAMASLDFFPFAAEYDAENNLFQIYLTEDLP